MKLNIPERLALLNILPQQGSIVTLRIVRELQSKLGFTEEELKHYNIRNTMMPDGTANIAWNPEMTEETKEIEIGEVARSVIIEQLKMLDSQGRLHVSMLPLYEKFVEGKE